MSSFWSWDVAQGWGRRQRAKDKGFQLKGEVEGAGHKRATNGHKWGKGFEVAGATVSVYAAGSRCLMMEV